MLGTVVGANSPARGKIRERILMWTALVFFLAKNVEGGSMNLKALKTGHRFNTSAYVDSYFSCNVCGNGIQWLVNGQDAGGHLSSDTAGSVSSQPEIQDNTALRYTSILLSIRSNCLDVVLIVSQAERDFYDNPPQVTCRGSTQQQEVQVKMPIQQFEPETINGTVTLTRVLGRSDIVVSLNDNSYITHIYVCSTTESTQFWRHNQRPAGGFNELNYPGFHEFTLLSSDPSISSQEAVLLVKRPLVGLTSVLLLTNIYSSFLNFTVLCGSNTNYAFLNDSSIKKELRGNSTTTSDTETNTTSEEIIELYNYLDDVTETYNYSDDVTETESTTIRNARSWHYIGIIFIFISITSIAVIIITVILGVRRHKQCKWRIQHITSHSKNLSDMECGLQHITSLEMPKTDKITGQKLLSANSNSLQHCPGTTIHPQEEHLQHDVLRDTNIWERKVQEVFNKMNYQNRIDTSNLTQGREHSREDSTKNIDRDELSGEINTSNLTQGREHLGEDSTRYADKGEISEENNTSNHIKSTSIKERSTHKSVQFQGKKYFFTDDYPS